MFVPIDAPTLVLSLQEAKDWLRVSGTREDALIQSLIQSAHDRVEDYTGLALTISKYRVSLRGWPDFGITNNQVSDTRFPAYSQPRAVNGILLPRSPLISIESVKYRDVSGAMQTLDPASYFASVGSTPSELAFDSNLSFPSLFADNADRPDNVQIEFTAGYDPNEPVNARTLATIKMAARYYISHYYDVRSPVVVGTTMSEVPLTVRNVLRALRIDQPFNS